VREAYLQVAVDASHAVLVSSPKAVATAPGTQETGDTAVTNDFNSRGAFRLRGGGPKTSVNLNVRMRKVEIFSEPQQILQALTVTECS
jgi:hypothetical protein